MEINFDKYNSDRYYNYTLSKENENDIIEYFLSADQKRKEELMHNNVINFLHFSNLCQNIIKWYPITQNDSVLEICGDFGQLTGVLIDKSRKVVTVEPVKSHAEVIKERYKNVKKLSIFCSNIEDLELNEKFDYISLIGVLEYAQNLCPNKEYSRYEAAVWLLNQVKKFLKSSGKILIATDNKFGIRYFAGGKHHMYESAFESITSHFSKDTPRTFSKYELENIFKQANFSKYKFYYPLPDYTLTNVIFSDSYIPNGNNSKLMYNVYYKEFENILFSEGQAMKELTKNNQFKFFANSFFVELNNLDSDNFCDIRFVGFNNMRGEKYRLITEMFKDKVLKEKYTLESEYQIYKIKENIDILQKLGFNIYDKVQENKVISMYISDNTLDEVLSNAIIDNKIEETLNIFDLWYKYIYDRLTKERFSKEKDKEKSVFEKFDIDISGEEYANIYNELNFVKHGFLDLVLENIFYNDGNYILYDQEWYEKNIPVEFILYRAINNFYFYNRFVNRKLPKEKLFEKYKLLNYIELFQKLEEKWQSSISDKEIVEFYSNTYKQVINIDEINQKINGLNKQIKIFESDNKILMAEVKRLEKINEELQKSNNMQNEKLNRILNSRTWKYTKFLRKGDL